MPLITIHGEGDPRVADYRNIPDHELVQRRGIFVAEGRLVVRRFLMESPLAARSVMATSAALESMSDLLASRPDLPVYQVTQTTMAAVAGFNIHRGCLAIGERPASRAWPDVVAQARTIVVLEQIGNADNVGGIFRNAVAFGADAVLLGPACADPLYRKAIRTSMGGALLMPFAEAWPWPGALGGMRDAGFSVVAMTPSADAPRLRDVADRLRGAPVTRVAIVLGHEGEGLTVEAMDACSHRARVPMGALDSLNVASASAIALYELMQRA